MSKNPVLFGYFALLMSTLALILALVHVFGGPFAPRIGVEVGLAEFIGSLKDAVARKVAGDPDTLAQTATWDIDRFIHLSASIISAIALVFAMAGYLRREPVRVVAAAGLLALFALTFQLIVWYATLLIGVLVLFVVLSHFREMLESIFD
ncbi:MAG: hypothetical protein AB8B51_07470 [Sedimentitalea sp.]